MTRRLSVVLSVAFVGIAFVFAAGMSRGTPGDDATDMLQSRINALQPGGTLTLDPGVYPHSGVLHIRVPGVRINGNNATLQATNAATSSVQVLANGVVLENINLTGATSGKRWSGVDQHKLLVRGNDVTLRNISITGSAAAGVFLVGANNFAIDGVTVRETRADGIHITGGSSNGRVSGSMTEGTGDDGFAVISYHDAPPSSGIVLDSPVVNGTAWGRGVAVVGGNRISISDVRVSGTSGAGIYIATEGSEYVTQSVDGVDVSGGSVTDANRNPGVVQGAVLVYSGNGGERVSDVTIFGITISGTAPSAQRNVSVIRDAGTISGVAFRDIRILQSDLPAFYSNAPASSYTTTGFARG